MSKTNTQLSKHNEQTLAEMFETKYFQALTELANDETAVILDALLDKNKPDSQLRFYQGRAEEVKIILERIALLHEQLIENPSPD